MRIFTFRLAVLCTALLTTFSATAQDLRPATQVEQATNQSSFEEQYQLFVNAKSSGDVAALKALGADYEVFTLDPAQLGDLQKSSPEQLTLDLPGRLGQVSLVRANIFAEGFKVTTSNSNDYTKTPLGLHYRGVVTGDDNSVVAISILDGEVSGMIANKEGNFVLGKLQGKDDRHVLYNDQDLPAPDLGECETPDSGLPYSAKDLAPLDASEKDANNCVNVYMEVDNSIYTTRGSDLTNVTNFITGLFNQTAVLYANEQINLVMSELFVWTSTDPYNSGTSSGNLDAFRNRLNGQGANFNGDIAHLVSFQSSGGVAYVNVLCNDSYGYGFSSINNSFNNVPTYSWSVNVLAHELGHNFGSQHTHACVWNGDNTAIDGCYGTEGGCNSSVGLPSGGGTIMSYCHLTSAGVNFNNGFGTQPGNLIRNRAYNGSCLTSCSVTPPGGGGGGGGGTTCTDTEATITILTDNYPGETRWTLTNAAGSTVASGGPYAARGTTYTEEACLPEGCYTFTITDSYGDGICCAYGNGSYTVNFGGTDVATGGAFGRSESKEVCITGSGGGDGGGDGDGDGDPTVCDALDFGTYAPGTYGGTQDKGQVTVVSANEIEIRNNAWKTVLLDYVVTADTRLEFDFGSTKRGEIHGIGFDDNSGISSNRTFQLYGSQNWGIGAFKDYATLGSWKSYVIPVGEYYTGTFNRLFFAADHDGGTRDGTSMFRNIRIYEGDACVALVTADGQLIRPETQETVVAANEMEVFPNPASDLINLNVSSLKATAASLRIVDMTGRTLSNLQVSLAAGAQRLNVPVTALPVGTYLVRLEGNNGFAATAKFTVAR